MVLARSAAQSTTITAGPSTPAFVVPQDPVRLDPSTEGNLGAVVRLAVGQTDRNEPVLAWWMLVRGG